MDFPKDNGYLRYKSVVLAESKLTCLIQFFSHYFHTSLELYHRCVCKFIIL